MIRNSKWSQSQKKLNSYKSVYLEVKSMINPATGLILALQADHVANQVELAWLPRYPLHNKVTVDRGNEFLAKSSVIGRCKS